VDSEIDMTLDADTNSDTNTNKNGLNIEAYKNSLIHRADELHSFQPKIKKKLPKETLCNLKLFKSDSVASFPCLTAWE